MLNQINEEFTRLEERLKEIEEEKKEIKKKISVLNRVKKTLGDYANDLSE